MKQDIPMQFYLVSDSARAVLHLGTIIGEIIEGAAPGRRIDFLSYLDTKEDQLDCWWNRVVLGWLRRLGEEGATVRTQPPLAEMEVQVKESLFTDFTSEGRYRKSGWRPAPEPSDLELLAWVAQETS